MGSRHETAEGVRRLRLHRHGDEGRRWPDAKTLAAYTKQVEDGRARAAGAGGAGARREGREAGAGAREGRRAVGLRARRLRHQGEPHLRPGLRRHQEGQRRPEAVHLRPRGHAEPPRPGRGVRPARQLLLQRRALGRRPLVGERGLRHRLPGEVVRRLHAQLPLRRRPAGLLVDAASSGTTLSGGPVVPQLRRDCVTPSLEPAKATFADVWKQYRTGKGKVDVQAQDGHRRRWRATPARTTPAGT